MANNNYLWQEFNIKTFPAETIVFLDGVFRPELSTLESATIDQKHDLPVHIIYAGEIADENNLDIDIKVADQKVFLTAKVKNKKPAFLNIFIKNTGKKSFFQGRVLVENYSELDVYTKGHHLAPDTEIIIMTKLLAHVGTKSKLIGDAEIEKDCPNCNSDIGFSAMAASDAKIEFAPKQFIKTPPESAKHSASIYKGSQSQIDYLRQTGLGGAEVKAALEEAFANDFGLF